VHVEVVDVRAPASDLASTIAGLLVGNLGTAMTESRQGSMIRPRSARRDPGR